MMKKRLQVFLSYSKHDSVIAQRIYNDLKRSGISVWRFEEDSERGVDFRQEYLERLVEADFYCLLDSLAARSSDYVTEEIVLGLEHFASRKAIAVCNLASDKQWRYESSVLAPQIQEQLNRITYHDFSPANQEKDRYDQHDQYLQAIRGLLQQFGDDYVSWAANPWMQDIRKEFFAVLKSTSMSLDTKNRDRLIDEFHLIYGHWGNGNLSGAQRRLELFLEENPKLPTVSPQLFLGMLYLDLDAFEKAEKVYQAIAAKVPTDPRGWYGCGLALAPLASTDVALLKTATRYFEKALELIKDQPENKFHQLAKPRVLMSLVLMRLRLKEADEAQKVLNRIERFYGDLPEVQALGLLCSVADGEMAWVHPKLVHLNTQYAGQAGNTPDLNYLLTNLNIRMGEGAARQGQNQRAIRYFRWATQTRPEDITLWAKLALLCYAENEMTAMRQTISQGKTITGDSPVHYYYLGQLQYLAGEYLMSQSNYRKAQQLGWPPYDKLM